MPNITIIGIGSPHGADQVGWQAIESLKNYHALQRLTGESINFLSLDRPGMALLDHLDRVDYAILIDAIADGAAGTIVEVNKEQLLNNLTNISSHDAGVAEVLAMGNALNILPQKIEIYGIETGASLTDNLSDPSVFDKLNQLICDHVRSYINLQ